MSRHRNVRNLTEDDYYDDYDDDYYDDDDDDYYYQQQQQEQAQQQQQQRAQAAAISSIPIVTKKTSSKKNKDQQQQQQPTTTTTTTAEEEKERLLVGMGFSIDQVKSALVTSNGDVQQAANTLLLHHQQGRSTTATMSSSPTKQETSSSVTTTFAGISKPPPGFTKPTTTTAPLSSGRGTSPTKKPTSPSSSSAVSASTTTTTVKEPAAAIQMMLPQAKIPESIQRLVEKQRSQLAMVVLGHVDAGKSTLMGQVLLQLGQVQKRTVTKYQKQAAELGKASFALAWVMDEDDSERERGVTMEVGTKYVSTQNHDLIILDAPGHADFIPAMITGAASADVGLLVVAATPGEFEAGFAAPAQNKVGSQQHGGQTREHVVLARGLGVSQLIVAVNKLDAAEPRWSQERFEEIKNRLMPFLQASGFQPKRVRFVPLSGLNGVNIVKDDDNNKATSAVLPPELKSWYKDGPTLLEAIDGFVPAQRSVDKPLRVIVTDVYAEGSKGVTTRGRVISGVVQAGEKLVVLPIGDEATVGRIEHGTITSDASLDRLKVAFAGDTVELVLNGIDIVRLSPGCVLSHPHLQLRPPVCKKIQAKILVMEDLSVPIIRGATVLLHMHSIDVPAVVSKLVAITKRDGSIKKERPRVLTGGASATVEITLSEKICMEEYTECRPLGRFVLRRGGDTIALGIVEKILVV